MQSHYLICYDIQTQWVRYRIDKLLSGYGERVQYSVFECSLSDAHLVRLRTEIRQWLEDGDKVNYYRLCEHCLRRRLTHGAMVAWRAKAYEYVD